MKEKSKILGTFPDTFFKMATDIIFHRFWVDLDSLLGCFLELKSPKMEIEKHSKNIPAKKSCAKSRAIPGLPPVVPEKNRSKDPRTGKPNQRIRDTPLVPGGTVADSL